MSGKTSIEWTDRTWNPVVGCERISPGCAHCYAKTIHDLRHRAALEGKQIAAQYREPFETVQLMPARLVDPLRWRAPGRVFVNSVSDLWHDDVPDEFIAAVFVVMGLAERQTFQVLTKRPARMRDFLRAHDFVSLLELALPYLERTLGASDLARIGGEIMEGEPMRWPLPNVWLLVSTENQRFADERIPILLETPAAVRGISAEPLLGPIDLARVRYREHSLDVLRARYRDAETGSPPDGVPTSFGLAKLDRRLDWVIVGGESGAGARPMRAAWARALRDQCAFAGVRFFFKQWGEWGPAWAAWERASAPRPDVELIRYEEPPELLARFGWRKTGRALDGREWNEFPGEAT